MSPAFLTPNMDHPWLHEGHPVGYREQNPNLSLFTLSHVNNFYTVRNGISAALSQINIGKE